jgi:transposase
MTTTRRSFTDEFKREAVSLLASSGRPLTQVATELGIQPSMLRTWRGAAIGLAKPAPGPGGPPAAATASAEQAEIRRLRRELERAQVKRDILKKAIGIFSVPPR